MQGGTGSRVKQFLSGLPARASLVVEWGERSDDPKTILTRS